MVLVKNPPVNAGGMVSIPGLGISPGVGNGSPPQYSCMENSMDRGAWRAVVHGATESQTCLSNGAQNTSLGGHNISISVYLFFTF